MSIELHTVDNGNVQAINDGRLYSQLTGAVGGIVAGANCSSSGGLVVSVTSGWGIASGRVFTITAENYTVAPSPSGTRKGRLYVKIDLTDADEPIKVLSITGTSLPALVQQDLSNGGTVYEIELAHYDITTLAVSNLVSNSKITITPVPKSGGTFSGDISAPNLTYKNLTITAAADVDITNLSCWINTATNELVIMGYMRLSASKSYNDPILTLNGYKNITDTLQYMVCHISDGDTKMCKLVRNDRTINADESLPAMSYSVMAHFLVRKV